MIPTTPPPLTDYVIKLMLLEAILCYQNADPFGLRWLERQMFIFHARIQELNRRDY
jgi:hypothetical protein